MDHLRIEYEDGRVEIRNKTEIKRDTPKRVNWKPKEKSKIAEKTETGKATENWSTYQGEMNWEAAKEICASLNMRLPTIDELGVAYKAGVTESWKKDGAYYWSSKEFSEGSTYYFHITNGVVDTFTKYTGTHVRCIR
jgi:hypothetical protein